MFSECNQAIDIIVGNIQMVVDELMELRLKTSMEETYSILVGEVTEVAPESFEQGNVLIDRAFLAQVSDQIESVFVIKWGCCFIQSQTEE